MVIVCIFCSECHSENEIRPKDPIRCRECGYRIMYKKRTKRSILFNAHHNYCIINHTLHSTIRAVISTLTCTSMASNSTSDSECYFAVRVHVRVLLLP